MRDTSFELELTKKKEVKKTGNGSSSQFDLSKELVGLGQEQPEKPPSAKKGDIDRMRGAGEGRTGYERDGAIRKAAEKIAQEQFEAGIRETRRITFEQLKRQWQKAEHEFRNANVGVSATGRGITRKDEFVEQQTSQLVAQFREAEKNHKRAALNESFTAERAFEQSGRFGNSFE